MTVTVKSKPDASPYKKIPNGWWWKWFKAQRVKSYYIISHSFFWDGNAVSAPREHDSSYLKVGVNVTWKFTGDAVLQWISIALNAIFNIFYIPFKLKNNIKKQFNW